MTWVAIFVIAQYFVEEILNTNNSILYADGRWSKAMEI
jgi:hypothetical protein